MKTGFWLRGGNGKLAGATVYQDGQGNTVMREVVSPSNPKTRAQMIQRIVMHTVMQAYSKMKEICDHSLEGVKKGQETMSLFMKENVQKCRAAVAEMQAQGVDFYDMYNFVPLGRKGFTPNQYLMSMGSLPTVTTQWIEDPTDEVLYPYLRNISANTYAAVINDLGLKRGDQLTFIEIVSTGSDFSQNEFHFCRVILDPTTSDFQPAPLDSPFLTDQHTIAFPSVRNEGSFRFTIDSNGLRFGKSMIGALNDMAACVIVSRKQGDEWCRSTQYLTYPGQASNAYSMGDCLALAEEGAVNPIYAGNSQYLNNAGEGGGAAATTDSGSGSGSGEQTQNTFAISSASVNNQAIVVGTVKNVYCQEGEDTESLDIRMTFSNKGNATAVIVEKNGAQVGAEHTISGTSASFTIANAAQGLYTIKVKKSDNTIAAPGYQVRLNAYVSNGPDDNGYDPELGDGN